MMLEPGATATRSKTFTAADIEGFAHVSGDTNPIHLNAEYAATTPFGRRIAHGLLTASLISAVLANDLPGPGSIYLAQTLSFRAPVYIDDTITATVTVTAFRADKRIATLRTVCMNQDGKLVLEGEATVIAPP